ncbi:MAG: hypothetical protein ACXWC6_11340 [Ramlibacter sp.]
MQRLAALAFPCLVLLAGCATQQQAASSCELSTVPAQAVFGVREGLETATYPSQIPGDRTGCQRVWWGEHQRPDAMRVLATYYFEQGHVRRLVGQVPGGQAYDCHYRDGALDNGASRNPGLCPDAAQAERAPLGRP